jgi:hypothetical protein
MGQGQVSAQGKPGLPAVDVFMQAAGYGLTRFYLAHTRINKLTLRSLAGSSKGVAPAGEHSPGPLEVPQTKGINEYPVY